MPIEFVPLDTKRAEDLYRLEPADFLTAETTPANLDQAVSGENKLFAFLDVADFLVALLIV